MEDEGRVKARRRWERCWMPEALCCEFVFIAWSFGTYDILAFTAGSGLDNSGRSRNADMINVLGKIVLLTISLTTTEFDRDV